MADEQIKNMREKVDVWKIQKYSCKAKIFDVNTGKKTVILNESDAKEHDIYLGYRTTIRYKDREIVALVDLSSKYISPGEIGVFKELADELGLNDSEEIEIIHMDQPKSLSYIKDKLEGRTLSADAIDSIIKDLMQNKLGDVELAAWICGVYTKRLSDEEIVALTNSIVNSGEILDLGVKPICDKHCIGGVAGNRTTMIVVPIVAAAGVYIPKSSSRSITSAAGTADVMELLAPVDLKMDELKEVVLKAKGAMVWGGGLNLASADDKLIKIRNPLKLDPEGMLLSSILAKKKAVNATHVVIDIPVGRGAKIEDIASAKILGEHFIQVGQHGLGMNIESIISDGSEPIGSGIGVALEARDVLMVLENSKILHKGGDRFFPSLKGPEDLKQKSCLLAGKLLELCGKVEKDKGYEVAEQILLSGKALAKFKEIIELQGGDPKVTSKDIEIGKYEHHVYAKGPGKIHHIDSKVISKIARLAGAPKDPGAGVYLYRSKGDTVRTGDKLFSVYSNSKTKHNYVVKALEELEPIEKRKFILGVLD